MSRAMFAKAALAGTAISVLLAGCGSGTEESSAAEPSAPSSSAPPPPTPSPSEPASNALPPSEGTPTGGSKFPDCIDADCKVLVADGDQIVLDPKFGISPVAIRVGTGIATGSVTTADGTHQSFNMQPTEKEPEQIGKVLFKVTAIKNGKAAITIAHS